MSYTNIEIKARCPNPDAARKTLMDLEAEFHGTDHQCDTYFRVSKGRLKLREGNIETNLIYYERPDQAGPKHSAFSLIAVQDPQTLKMVLETALGVLAVVRKKREIFYIGNVKFHIDQLAFGNFIEIEAGNVLASLSADELRKQCDEYMQIMGISGPDLVEISYSDMALKNKEPNE